MVHLRARIAAAGMALVGAVVVMGIVDSSRCPPEARLRVKRRAYRTIRRDLCVLSWAILFLSYSPSSGNSEWRGPRLPRRGEGWDDPRLVGKETRPDVPSDKVRVRALTRSLGQ